jgi:hypothetical protein
MRPAPVVGKNEKAAGRRQVSARTADCSWRREALESSITAGRRFLLQPAQEVRAGRVHRDLPGPVGTARQLLQRLLAVGTRLDVGFEGRGVGAAQPVAQQAPQLFGRRTARHGGGRSLVSRWASGASLDDQSAVAAGT